jgi:hypothetical protein
VRGTLSNLWFALLFPAALAGCRAEPDEVVPAPVRAPVAAVKKPAQPPPPCDSEKDPVLTQPFIDTFDRAELGDEWRSTSYGAYFIRSGRLCISKPRNHPLWLKKKLPTNVRVEFEATPTSNTADVKVELFGDGCAFDAEGRDYTATAYVAVLGAHNNTEHWLARLFEHGPDAKKTQLLAGAPSLASSRLIAQTNYHVELERTEGKTLTFKVDGTLIHDFVDAQPLAGPGHDHFAFNGWDAPSCFDKLTVTPLP